MIINQPTYLIAELSGDIVTLVQQFRRQFNPDRVNWPIDITIAGSSGIGTFSHGQKLSEVIDKLEFIIYSNNFTEVEFTGVDHFDNTGIYYLVPKRKKFDVLHQAVINSEVIFNSNSWPYNPHCTLRAGSDEIQEFNDIFSKINVPKSAIIECISIYQPETNSGNRLHRF
jgi:2'-5' RNA ligase